MSTSITQDDLADVLIGHPGWLTTHETYRKATGHEPNEGQLRGTTELLNQMAISSAFMRRDAMDSETGETVDEWGYSGNVSENPLWR